jgi:hypothetical protein
MDNHDIDSKKEKIKNDLYDITLPYSSSNHYEQNPNESLQEDIIVEIKGTFSTYV